MISSRSLFMCTVGRQQSATLLSTVDCANKFVEV